MSLWQKTYTLWQSPVARRLMSYQVCKQCMQAQKYMGWSKRIIPMSSYRPAQLTSVVYMSSDKGSAETVAVDQPPKDSLGLRILKGVAWMGGFYSKKAVIQRAAANIYKCCADDMNYKEFLELCKMPDTFQSWFLVLQLHIWMCLVRLKKNGKEGRIAYRTMVSIMWDDVEERMKSLGVDDPSTRKESLKTCVEEFYGLIVAYDEGLVSGDRVLATALWRNMVSNKKETDLVSIARLTRHVRKQIHALDQLDTEQLLAKGVIEWLPLDERDSLQK